MCVSLSVFFFNDPAPTDIYTLSLHDALPISRWGRSAPPRGVADEAPRRAGARTKRPLLGRGRRRRRDRKSTRLNSSHVSISYAVFCLKKKRKGQMGRRVR